MKHLDDGYYIGGLTMPKEGSTFLKKRAPKHISYLIKRSNSFRDLKKNNSKNKGYFEINISKDKRNPPSSKVKIGDVIYVAETSGGIYAKGEVINSLPVKEFGTIEELLIYSKKFNDDSYWLDKIRVFQEKLSKNKDVKLRCHEYFINQKLLPRTIPYNGPLQRYDASLKRGLASIFFKLNSIDVGYLKNPDYDLKKVEKLDPKIPGDLRLKIYSFFNQNNSFGHLIDIDHFVPKSVGGPGNIIENLVPVGFSLNRYKSDSIPRSFFEVALEEEFKERFINHEKNILKILKDESLFISRKKSPESHEIAKQINASIYKWHDMERIKKFYYEVNKKFNPEYVKTLKTII